MIDGFYRMAFTGAAGSGFGMLAFQNGMIAGADIAGATYDGSYTENPTMGEISFQVTMAAPAGITPVQTGIPLTAPESIPITGKFKPEEVATEKPFLLQTPLGPVNVIFQKDSRHHDPPGSPAMNTRISKRSFGGLVAPWTSSHCPRKTRL